MKVVIVSDTHGDIHPRAFDYLQDADLILHAGDIGNEDVIAALEACAPVYAVIGNTDSFDLTQKYPISRLVEVEGKRLLLTHGHVVRFHSIQADLADKFAEQRPDAIIYGHTHKAEVANRKGVLFINPGSAGVARFGGEMTLAVMEVEAGGQLRPKIMKLHPEA